MSVEIKYINNEEEFAEMLKDMSGENHPKINEMKLCRQETPDILGLHIRHFPAQAGIDNDIYKVVLVELHDGYYTAYIGAGSNRYVADLGNRITFEEAKLYFPNIEERKYRNY